VLTLSLVVQKVSLIAISPNVRRLLIKVLEVFEAFQKQHMGSFLCANLYRRLPTNTVLILQKLNFRTEYSAPADTLVVL